MLYLFFPPEGFPASFILTFLVFPAFTQDQKKPNNITYNNSPFLRCPNTTLHAPTSLVMMFAKCSNDLMNAPISGNQRNMKGKSTVGVVVSQIFNYLSGEGVFYVLIKTVLTSAAFPAHCGEE